MVEFPPLTEARFIERPNRFLVKVDIGGKPANAHLHDPGRLRELLVPGAKLYLQKAENPQRKTAWDIILVKKGPEYVAIYSTLANKLAKKLFAEQCFPGFKSWKLERSEPRFGNSRFDFELAKGMERMLVEVKSASLVVDDIAPPAARFPDAPTERGRRHLLELGEAVSQGYKALVIFIVTRCDAGLFMPHAQRDPRFADTLKQVAKQGVKMHCYKCKVDRKSIALDSKIPIRFC
jgi:sugar fermentation stimulation protein